MGKVLIVSDNHGRIDTLKKIIDMEKPVDLVIHCGDSEMTDIIPTLTKHSDARVYAVSGNCDIFSDLPSRADFDYMGHHILVVHGHYDNVSYGIHELYRKAKMTGSDIVFFGHTHVPFLRKDDGVTFANPGSTDKPRQTSRESTYMIMSVDETSGPDFELKKCFI